VSDDPRDPESCLIMVVLNFDLVSNLHLASAPAQPHTVVADIEGMREMALFASGDPDSHWHDRFGSLRPPFPYARSSHVPRSLRIAVFVFVVIIVIFFAVVFLFVLFIVWFFSNPDIGSQ
jgi:hypothetical protein